MVELRFSELSDAGAGKDGRESTYVRDSLI